MMRFAEIMRLVWVNIMENKFKMLLTSLGIIVGAATIVLVIAIGQGSQEEVEDQFKNLNAGAIDVSVGSSFPMGMMMGGPVDMGAMRDAFQASGGGSQNRNSAGSAGGAMPSMPGGGASSRGNNAQGPGNTTLTIGDVNDILQLVQGLEQATILQSGESTVYGGSLEEEKTSTIVGIYPEYQYVSNLSVLMGRFLEEYDEDGYYAVIGYTLAEDVFEYVFYAVGDYIEIEGKTYEVVGVLEKMGSVSSGISPDNAIYLPYTTAAKQVFGNTVSPQIAAVAKKVSDVSRIMDDINAVLTENHPNASFTISDAGSAKEVASNSANTLSLLLLAVASIVFIVGGIGIMNVMFVSVKERTGEIGILKAVGCSKRTILVEFLLEAAIISVVGGLIGIGAGSALMPLVELFGIRASKSIYGLILALMFAAVTGTVFGFYPAWKASRLVPIEALDSE